MAIKLPIAAVYYVSNKRNRVRMSTTDGTLDRDESRDLRALNRGIGSLHLR